MFPSTTTDHPTRRSLRELMRGALGTALEFATLGEATLAGPPSRPAPPAHVRRTPASSGARVVLRARAAPGLPRHAPRSAPLRSPEHAPAPASRPGNAPAPVLADGPTSAGTRTGRRRPAGAAPSFPRLRAASQRPGVVRCAPGRQGAPLTSATRASGRATPPPGGALARGPAAVRTRQPDDARRSGRRRFGAPRATLRRPSAPSASRHGTMLERGAGVSRRHAHWDAASRRRASFALRTERRLTRPARTRRVTRPSRGPASSSRFGPAAGRSLRRPPSALRSCRSRRTPRSSRPRSAGTSGGTPSGTPRRSSSCCADRRGHALPRRRR